MGHGSTSEEAFSSNSGLGDPVIVPQPAEWKHGSSKLSIDVKGFQFLTAIPPGPDLTDAFERYRRLMFPHPSMIETIFHEYHGSCVLDGVQLWVADNHGTLEVGSLVSPIMPAETCVALQLGLAALAII